MRDESTDDIGGKLSEDIDAIVVNAIAFRLGNIDSLPEIARSKIGSVYRAFYIAYLDIAKLKGVPSDVLRYADLDLEIIEYMQHFFSDYQHLYREFIALNYYARTLMEIDRHRNPESFKEGLNTLVAGTCEPGSEPILEGLLTL